MTSETHSVKESSGCSTGSSNAQGSSADVVRQHVRSGYSKIATRGGCGEAGAQSGAVAEQGTAAGGCCGATPIAPEQLVTAIGYSQQELSSAPDAANMGLSCGNPTALASLKTGEVVVDLGAGGGFDVFIAGPKVGPEGRVIGVDMTPEMVSLARRNIDSYRRHTGLDNVEFRLGEIEHLPVPNDSVDVVISNCVLNLSPDKPQVWREIFRVLKPGGRVAVSDLALLRSLPEAVRQDVEALVGCIAGAVLIDQTRQMIIDAGFAEIHFESKPQYIDAMTSWEDPLYRRIVDSLPRGTRPADFITSLDISAKKPVGE